MADIPPLPLSPTPAESPRGHGAAQLAYILFGIAALTAVLAHGLPVVAPLFGIVGVIAIIVAYVARGDAQGSYVATHFRWLIRTFWFSLLWAVVGLLLAITLIGFPIAWLVWFADSIWVIYRVVRGYLLFREARAVPGM
jgi:uncharacterized membrane protein